MSQPLGPLRFTHESGAVCYVEASEIHSFRERLDGPDMKPSGTIIFYKRGTDDVAKEPVEALVAGYISLVYWHIGDSQHGAKWGLMEMACRQKAQEATQGDAT